MIGSKQGGNTGTKNEMITLVSLFTLAPSKLHRYLPSYIYIYMLYNDAIYIQNTHHYSINPRGWGRAKYYIPTYPRIIHVTRYHNNIHTMRVYGRIIIFVPTPRLRGLTGRMLERAAYSPETMCSRSPSFRQPPAAVVTQAPVERECGPTVTRVSVVVVSAITISLSLRLSPSSSPSSQSLVYDKVVHVLVRVSSAPSQYTRARPMEQLLFNEVWTVRSTIKTVRCYCTGPTGRNTAVHRHDNRYIFTDTDYTAAAANCSSKICLS